MYKLNQEKTPIADALDKMRDMRLVPFDVPGHKRGRGNKKLTEFFGKTCVEIDVNSMKMLDYLSHPVSVIKEAEALAADAFDAKHAFFMVNGTSSCVQVMIMSTCKENEKIILPRNVHKSAINALVLTGAVPVYINPKISEKLSIALGMALEDVKNTINKNKDAKAVLVNNPTYYGICSNLEEITKIAHKNNIKILVDEAHGTHFYFNKNLPKSAMEVGADMASVSMHKSGGSLTQSSFLLTNNDVDSSYVRSIINLTQTTSASYLLLASLDLSRSMMAIRGEEITDKVIELSDYARKEINEIGGYYAYSKEIINKDSIYDFDTTKLSINTLGIGLSGFEVYDLLRDEYNIQIEFGDLSGVLAYVSVGDNYKNIERLVSALYEIKRIHSKENAKLYTQGYIEPILKITPKEAFYADKKTVAIKDAKGFICAESVMAYPPGIPVVAPGELITDEIIEYIYYAKDKGTTLSGTRDEKTEYIDIIK